MNIQCIFCVLILSKQQFHENEISNVDCTFFQLSSPCATASAASSSSDNDDDQDAPSRYRHGSWSSNSSLGSDDFSSYMQRPMSWTPQSSQSANEDRHFNSRRHMDPSHRHNADSQGSAKKAKLRQLQRQYSNVRKRLEELEQEQEKTQGYRLSQAEKLKLKPLRKLIAEQTRLKRQIRSCRDDESTESLYNASSVEEDAMPGSPGSDSSEVSESLAFLRQDSPRVSFSRGNNNGNHRDLESMRNTMLDIERTLKVQRQIAGRPFELENMTSEQVNFSSWELFAFFWAPLFGGGLHFYGLLCVCYQLLTWFILSVGTRKSRYPISFVAIWRHFWSSRNRRGKISRQIHLRSLPISQKTSQTFQFGMLNFV